MNQIAEPVAVFQPQNQQQAHAMESMEEFAMGTHGARLMTLNGYAGTGKSTLVGELTRRLAGKMRIALTAPTHKAVKVLMEKFHDTQGADFATLHSALGLRLKRQHDGTYKALPEGDPTVSEYDLLVVDECSMIHREIFLMLMSPAFQGTRILFVGDPAQLPPVEGSGEPSMAFTQVQHQVRLTQVCRQSAGNPIIKLSMTIRSAMEQGARLDALAMQAHCAAENSEVLIAAGGSVTAYNWALHELRAGCDVRILAWRNATVRAYNRDIHGALYGDETPFAVGETLMLNDSYKAREATGGDPMRAAKMYLHNSEETKVVAVHRANHPRHDDVPAWQIVVERDAGQQAALWMADDEDVRQRKISGLFREASQLKTLARSMRHGAERDATEARASAARARAWGLKEDLADARHVYAMTVHKSQGSTFHTAIVDLDDLQRNRGSEYNQMLYVAATRPSHHLALVA